MPSATRAVPRRFNRGRRKSLLQQLGPLLIALVLTPIAVRSAGIFAISGPFALTLLYPWIVLAQKTTHFLTAPQIEAFSNWTLWLMLPVYAIILILMKRSNSLASGVFLVLILHGLAAMAALIIS